MNTILYVGEHPRSFDVHLHMHDHWEMVYCTEGSGVFLSETGEKLPYKEGDLVLIPPRVLHSNRSIEGFANIHLNMDTPTFPEKTMFKVRDDSSRRIRSIFEQSKYYYLSGIHKRELILTALGDLLCAYVLVDRSNNDFSQPVAQILHEIMEHYGDPDFALDQVLRSLPFHYDYLRKLFQKEVGVTPLEYLTGIRMKKAESILNLMRSDEFTMTEVAKMCGYEDSLYFSRVFKKHFGCSPTMYTHRRALSGDKESVHPEEV